MAEQLSLFSSPEPEETPAAPAPAAAPAQPEPAPEPVAAYASVVLDIPTRALSEPFAYDIPRSLANEAQIGSTVLVHFGNRAAAGYIVDIAFELGDLQGNSALDPARIKPIEAILSKPLFTAEAARIARWMSREYVATLSECLRLFLPPGGSPRVVKGDDGMWTVERPAVKPIQNRWVMLTPEGFDYTPPKTAVRQRQLIEALQCGPVTTRDLNLLYNSMSATIKALEKRGVVVVEERREKAVLLHNRRGFAPFLMCRECGCVPTCNHCSTALTYHERTYTLQCHTCGSSWRVQPYPAPTSRCPKCGSRYLAKMGLGTQQIEDALHQMLPEDVAIIRMDADSTRGKDAHKKLLEKFDAADCAVLLGTQMIAKGLDFPEVTLVGVVNADFALKLPDFRAGERAYDLLEQVAGRAGRGDRPGDVIIQTYLPEDPVIRAVAEHDRSIFTDYDLDQRRDALYPPFVRLVNILVWSANRDDAQDYIGRIAKLLKRRWHAAAPDFLRAGSAVPQVLGPASCVIERAKDRYRFHLLVKSPVGYHVSDDIDACLKEVGSVRGVSVSVDVDAYDLM